MKTIIEYISEQMVCELSTDVLKSAYFKSLQSDRGEGRSKIFLNGLITKTADEAVSKVEKLGYDDIEGGEVANKQYLYYGCINNDATEDQVYHIGILIKKDSKDGVLVTYELGSENADNYVIIDTKGKFDLKQRISNRKLARSIVRLVKALVPQIQVTMDSVLKVD